MTAEVPLRRIEVSGLTSMSHAVLELSSAVTLLVGPTEREKATWSMPSRCSAGSSTNS